MIKLVTNVEVNVQKMSCISVFRYINQLTKVIIRINIIFIFLKYGLQQKMGRFISSTKFWKIFVSNNITSYCFYLQV